MHQVVHGGDRPGIPQQALRGHDDQGFARFPLGLPAQEVVVLRGGGGVRHPEVVLGAEGEEALQAGGGMFRSLSFLAMGQEEHQAAGLVPLLLRAREELVDDHLGAVGEIAELGFPEHQGGWIRHGVAELESQDGVLG